MYCVATLLLFSDASPCVSSSAHELDETPARGDERKCLLQQSVQKSVLQSLPMRIHEHATALDTSIATSGDTYDDGPGIAKFWMIAITSYLIALFLTICVWFWFFHKKFGMDDDDCSSDEGEYEDDFLTHSYSSRLLEKRPAMKVHTALSTWKQATHHERLEMSSLTAFIISCTMGIYAALRFVHRPACAPIKPNTHIPEMVGLASLIGLTGVCWLRPRSYLYWPAVAFLLLYIPAVALPPFNLSCQMLQSQACQQSDHWRISQARSHVDCSLQGQTAQQIFLTMFLLLPWLLPELKFLYLMCVWMFSVYIVWSVAYVRYSDDAGLKSFTPLDIVTRLVLLSLTLCAAISKKFYIQKSQQSKYCSDLARRDDTQKLYTILEFMLPSHLIMRMLMDPGEPIAEPIDEVSILFIVIDDFESIVTKKSPELLLRFLNQYFAKFDSICQHYGVLKIETVGEEYVCAVGVTPEDIQESKEQGHSSIIRRMFQAAMAILNQQNETVKFKMGMHTGPIVAGVIAQKLPRFRLFGDTINTAARMMQKGQVGMVQFGDETHKHLPSDIEVMNNGKVEMKGKGMVETYLFGGQPACEVVAEASVAFRGDDDVRPSDKSSSGDLLKVLLKPRQPFSNTDVASYDKPVTTGVSVTHFQDVVNEMLAESQRKAEYLLPMTRHLREKRWIMSEQLGFTPEMEEEFRHSFHRDHTCKKIGRRLDFQLVGIFTLSVMEFLWNLPSPQYPSSGWARDHDVFGTWARAPIFVVSRAAALSIVLVVRMVSVSEWVIHNTQFQSWLVVASCAIALALFLSYEVMITGVKPSEEIGPVWTAPFDQIFSLVFVLMFFFICCGHKVLFFQSLAFIPLALLIVSFTNIRYHSGIYFPVIGQVLFVVIAISFSALAHSEEQSLRARFKALDATRTTKDRVESILKTMMPPMVLEEVQSSLTDTPGGSGFTHHQYELATIAQSDLCGFTKIAASLQPSEVVKFISELFGAFDKLTDKFGIYKVETVGDAYIGGQAEYPLTAQNSPTSVIQFGIAMITEVLMWSKRLGVQVRCRVGVHHGQCIGGIVDKAMQRYHIFGELMHVIEILESTAPEGGIQVSPACREAVLRERRETGEIEKPELHFKERPESQLVTSKGEVHEFSETGGRTFVIQGHAFGSQKGTPRGQALSRTRTLDSHASDGA